MKLNSFGLWYQHIGKENNPTRDKGELWLGKHVHMEVRNHAIQVYYYATNIITFYDDGHIQLNSHGYRTPSTRQAMNDALPAWIRVLQKQGEWFVEVGQAGSYPFVEGFMIVEATEQPTKATFVAVVGAFNRVDRNRAMDKLIAGYIDGITADMLYCLLHPDKKNSPFAADCFICCHVMPELPGDYHLRLHVEQKSYQASLFLNAYIASGKYQNSLARLYMAVDARMVDEVKRLTRAFLRGKLLEKEVVN